MRNKTYVLGQVGRGGGGWWKRANILGGPRLTLTWKKNDRTHNSPGFKAAKKGHRAGSQPGAQPVAFAVAFSTQVVAAWYACSACSCTVAA